MLRKNLEINIKNVGSFYKNNMIKEFRFLVKQMKLNLNVVDGNKKYQFRKFIKGQ